MIGTAGRLLRGDVEQSIATMSRALAELKGAAEMGRAGVEIGAGVAQSVVEEEAASSREDLESLRGGLAEVENQIQTILRQIEELRSAEAAEQEAAQSGGEATDPLAAAAGLVSDAYAAIRDAFDP
jgi:hypothetical protein